MAVFQTTDLDFDAIKANLKTYLAKQPELADYNFEGAVINNILDVLAANTHYNALLANFAINESFLVSAQLRSSIISLAQSLGYTIRSRTASKAYLNISVDLSAAGSVTEEVVIPSGTKFSTSIDDVAYSFRTLESYTGVDNGSGVYTFQTSDGETNLPIYEGTLKSKRFIVGTLNEDETYVINDNTIDTNTMTVRVYESYTSTSYDEYTNILNQISFNETSTFYKVYELPNGYYEISFGDGVTLGKKPSVGSIIIVEYLSTVGATANGATAFTAVSDITVNSEDYSLDIDLVSASSEGASKQSIESIRKNAPLVFASQQRLVTPDDYIGNILSRYSAVSDVIAWGGEDNSPIDYGAIYICLQFSDTTSETSKTVIKDDIKNNLIKNMGITSITPKFSDPTTTYLILDTSFYYNPDLTKKSRTVLENEVRSKINNFVASNLKSLSGIFRKSNLLTSIDALHDFILSTRIDVKMSIRLTPVDAATVYNSSTSSDYTINFPTQITVPDDDTYSITSNTFYYNNVLCTLRNKLSTTQLEIVELDGSVVVDNIGSYSPSEGTVNLTAFAPGLISNDATFIKIIAVPSNGSVIKPIRNFILDYDGGESSITAILDKEDIAVSL